MRGDLNTFEIKCMYGEAFDSCTGCSQTIQAAYLEDRFSFMVNACNDSDYLEGLSGLTAMNAAIDFDDVASLNSDDDIDI
jgi:ubiquitin-like modifier-activating enzyme ATG7